MSVGTSMKQSRLPLLVGAVLVAVALIAGTVVVPRLLQRSRDASQTSGLANFAPPLPPADQTGKVGELVITAEAMELAEIKLASAIERSVAEKLAVSGSIESAGSGMVRITPRVSGKVVTLGVMVGDQVRAGQVIATLESTELARAQADFEHAEIGLALARKTLERQRKLASLGAFGNPRFEAARREADAAEGEVSGAEKDAAAARQEVLKARSARAALQGELAGAEADVGSAESDAGGAESQIGRAQNRVKSLQAALSQAETQVRVARSRFNRLDALLKAEIVSKQDWEQGQAELQSAEADARAAQANIAQAQSDVETARSALRSTQSRVLAARAKVRSARDRVEQAEAEIGGAAARQEQTEARLEQARKRSELTRKALAREEGIFRGGFATSKEILEAEGALQEALHEREHSARLVRLLGGGTGGGSIIPVVTPIAGRVQRRGVSVGQTVNDGDELFSVVNLDLVWAQLRVSPRDLPHVRIGQRAVLTSEAAPGKTFAGRVSAIDTVADETTRTVRVRVALDNRDASLRPDTFVRGTLTTAVRRNRVTVPVGALQEHQGKPTVYIARDTAGAFEVRHVRLGVRGDGWREVTQGLEPGERIASAGTFYLKSEALKSSLSDGCCAVEK